MRPDQLWIDGKLVQVDVDVQDSGVPLDQRAMRYLPTDKGAYAATQQVTCICLHDKGAEGTADKTFAYLKTKGYGVHGCIEADGKFVQFADFKTTRTMHGGRVNDFSVGIEITNAMFPDLNKRKQGEKRRPFLERLNRLNRPIVTRDYRGTNDLVYGHFPAQLDTVIKVVTCLCDELGVPKDVFVGPNGKPYGGLLPKLRTSPADKKKLVGDIAAAYRGGVIAHLNVSNRHVDPTGDVFEALIGAGFRATRIP